MPLAKRGDIPDLHLVWAPAPSAGQRQCRRKQGSKELPIGSRCGELLEDVDGLFPSGVFERLALEVPSREDLEHITELPSKQRYVCPTRLVGPSFSLRYYMQVLVAAREGNGQYSGRVAQNPRSTSRAAGHLPPPGARGGHLADTWHAPPEERRVCLLPRQALQIDKIGRPVPSAPGAGAACGAARWPVGTTSPHQRHAPGVGGAHAE